MVMMKIDRPDATIKWSPRPLPMPMPINPVDQATFDLLDGNGNNTISGDEWKGAGWTADRLEAFDGNKDGQVSRKEFNEGRRFEREFNDKDRNGDGKLSPFELLGAGIRKLQGNPVLAKLPGAKEALGAGAKGAEHAIAIIKPRPPLGFDRFERMDKDGDGAVSKSEYIAGRRQETKPRIQPWPGIRPDNPFDTRGAVPLVQPLKSEETDK